ncbi:MAG: hypothetical protein ACFCBU_12990 [Cyanophyceae cyanobacterium]
MNMLRQFWFSPALVVLSAIAAVDLPAQAQLTEEAVAEDTVAADDPPLNSPASAAPVPVANLSAVAIATPAAASVYAVRAL